LTDRAEPSAPTLFALAADPAKAVRTPRSGRRLIGLVPLSMLVGAGLLSIVVLLILCAPLVTPIDPRALALDARLQLPSALHPFGTDDLGRDLLARVLYGGRISLGVGVSAALLSSVAGAAIGLISPASPLLDAIVMRIMDGVMSIPTILLAIALVAVAGASVQNVVMAVTIVETPRIARIIRGEVLTLRSLPYIDAAIASGSSPAKIIWRHLLPGVLPQLTVQTTFVWAAAMIIEAGLSFIGAGTPPTTPSWGNIMADGRALWQIRPNLIFIPAAFLSVTLFGVNALGDGLRQVLNPRSAGGR
jgi:peptide/nickel transport system permease protein